MISKHAFRTPAEAAAASRQWVEIGSPYQAGYFARIACRMAREQHPRTFPQPAGDERSRPSECLHICPDCREEITGDPLPWWNMLLCLPCWVKRSRAARSADGYDNAG